MTRTTMRTIDAPPRPDQSEAVAIVAAFVGLMRGYTLRIANGRTLEDVREAMRRETVELDDELALASLKMRHRHFQAGVAS